MTSAASVPAFLAASLVAPFSIAFLAALSAAALIAALLDADTPIAAALPTPPVRAPM